MREAVSGSEIPSASSDWMAPGEMIVQ